MNYTIDLQSSNGVPRYEASQFLLACERDEDNTVCSLTVNLTEWEEDAYVFLPACVYNGNRWKKSYISYPPMYEKEDCGVHPAPVISDIPALNPDGSGKIQVTTGDLSVPCVGIYYRHKKQALLLFCEQECRGENIGFSVSRGRIEVQFPAMRDICYRMCRTNEPSYDTGFRTKTGDVVCANVIIRESCPSSLSEFFEYFFLNRKLLLSDLPAEAHYTDRLWDVLEQHMNDDNFSGEYYAETSKKWQCGWVGGGMSSLPLLTHGSPISRARSIMTLDFMTSHVSNAGFFYPLIENGVVKDDGFDRPHMKNAMLIRKNGDALYFLFKHFDVIDPKEAWVCAARRCADAFVRLHEKYGDFGQFIHVETGEMLYGGTTSGASVLSALVRAHRFFGDTIYLETAKKSGEDYYQQYVAEGVTYGGPGEALCAPDSESCYAMVESMVLLYEETGDEKWLTYAKDSLYLLSSWVMPYAYRFPAGSEFARRGINTVGSVFANAQNKHSAPGLCTASGDAIYRLYTYTEDEAILELLRDIVCCIPQCISTEESPILSWNNPPKPLAPGWICERVNTSDWEGKRGIGGVFWGSCWCETSALLTFSELIKNDEIRKKLRL